MSIINRRPIPETGAQVLTYKTTIVVSRKLSRDQQLKLGAIIAGLIDHAASNGTFLLGIDPDLVEGQTCQVMVELGIVGSVPSFLPGGADHES